MDSTPTRTPKGYRHLDNASAALLLFMTVWAPWAFGCTIYWTIWVMNYASYTLGGVLVAKWFLRWRTGYAPPRWSEPTPSGRWWVRLLALLTVFILGYVLVSVFNARATAEWKKAGVDLTYFDRTPISWLPSSYDASRSLPLFWNWLDVALVFWAARDWLLGKSRRERRLTADDPADFPTERLRVWLWVLMVSSSLLALECILQRLDGTNKLLWLSEAAVGEPAFHFGPFCYRANGAQYFNLVWPMALGFWWSLRNTYRERSGPQARVGSGAHVVLLPCTLLLAACPIISTSRGGALIMGVQAVGALVILGSSRGAGHKSGRWVLGGLFATVMALGLFLGGRQLSDRLAAHAADPLNGRGEVYEVAHRMAADFGWLGSGAGSFGSLYSLYRKDATEQWVAYAHNDWLETRITLGWIGLLALVLMLVIVPVLVRQSRGCGVPRDFVALLALSAGGMLVHAVIDFPFPVHSLLFLFVVFLAVASCFGRESKAKVW